MQCNACLIRPLMISHPPPCRFRAGFQQVFVCCAPTAAQEELELKSPRYLQTQVCVQLQQELTEAEMHHLHRTDPAWRRGTMK